MATQELSPSVVPEYAPRVPSERPSPEQHASEPTPRSSSTAVSQTQTGQCTPKEEVGWRKVVRNFTPPWFAATMGTGIVSILVHQLPYNVTAIQYIGVAFFCLNICLFTVFTLMSVLRYVLYPEIWTAMLQHPAQSLFLGCFPMGFATIINMMVIVCGHWGGWMVYWAWGFWWIDAALSVATCISMPFIVMHTHRPGLNTITAALLLPIVPAVVAAATGGLVAEALIPHSPSRAVITLVTSYILWGIGECFSAIVMALYFHRLTIHSLPPKEAIVSVFLPIGPLGQGGFGIQQLGRVALQVLPQTEAFGSVSADALHGGEVFYFLGVFLAFVMWGFALVWLSFALSSIAMIKKFPFNMGWWGFTFPLGVLATCTGLLAEDLSSTFFRILTMIFSVSVCLLWLLVATRTLIKAYTGEIFYAPCLQDLRPKRHTEGSDRTV